MNAIHARLSLPSGLGIASLSQPPKRVVGRRSKAGELVR
jgi:hypothetical protein